MFIGHIAAAALAQRACKRKCLGEAILAAQGPDVLWSVLVLAGVEQMSVEPGASAVYPLRLDYMPWSHGMSANLLWAGATFLVCSRIRRDVRYGAALAAALLSHWVLDALSHPPDMPIFFATDTPRVGLGLWGSLPATLAVELSLFGVALWSYQRTTRPRRARGSWLLGSLVGILLLMYAASIFVVDLTPQTPPIVVVGPGISMLLFAAWGKAIDRSRVLRLEDPD